MAADGSTFCEAEPVNLPPPPECPSGFTKATVGAREVCRDGAGKLHCDSVECGPPEAGAVGVASTRSVHDGTDTCTCVPATCTSGFTLQGATCVADVRGEKCGPEPELPFVCANNVFPCECVDQGGASRWECSDCPAVDCNTSPSDPACARDRACVACHGLASSGSSGGIENMHPWLYVTCVDCHGGVGVDPTQPTRQLTREQAHVSMPAAMAQGTGGTEPKRTVYENHYLGRGGVESLAGGPEWLRFVNPSDLRVVDQTCAKAGCHVGAGEKVRRSTMSTLTGKYDAMLQALGIPREAEFNAQIGSDSKGKHLATFGAARVRDPDWNASSSPPGSVPGLNLVPTFDRENERPYPTFTEADIHKETINKLCGDCHLGNNGSNDRYGQFRSSGCSACHVPYDYSGKSSSGDPMINKQEPSYPDAYTKIRFPERPHPIRHQITRIPTSENCFQCHTGSARSVLQYMGIRTDDNRDLTRAKAGGANIAFRYATQLVDNQRNPQARLRGFTMDQLIEYEDLDEDGEDDTLPDIHFEAGLECIDCHVSSEMHGDGRIYSRQSSATKIYCTHCHGTLEHDADPDDPMNPINELYHQGQRASRKVLWKFDRAPGYGEEGYPGVSQPGVWMRSRSKGSWHFVTQIRWGVLWDPDAQDCFGDGMKLDPRTNGQSCSAASSIAHGRYDGQNAQGGNLDNGVGTRPNTEVVQAADGTSSARFGFSHLGEPTSSPSEVPAGGLQCTACHGKWQAMRYGNHLGLKDTDGTTKFYEWDRVTGKTTIGAQQHFDFTYVSNLDLQLSVNSKGRIAWYLPARLKLFMRQTVLKNEQPFELMTEAGDANHIWKTYRDRVGMGNLLHGQGGVQNAPGFERVCLETSGYCDSDPKKNINGGLGMDQMEPHSVRRRTRDCTSCHLDEGGGGADRVGAVFGFSSTGYTAATSAYLAKIQSVQTNHGTYDTSNGFVIADDGIQHRLDWLVDEETGYPLVYNLHVRTDDGKDGRPGRGFDTYDPDTGGPITKQLIDKLKRIRVKDIFVDH
ncbi:MAG: hypothetical protein HY791_01635 [Deltaproteobacteria bacterium]|nr:hypothetical protein [Deltaproteobacteria bacterium]